MSKSGKVKCDFPPGVLMERVGLVVDWAQTSVSDVLHEADHLTVVLSRYRSLMHRNVDSGIGKMFDALNCQNSDADNLHFIQAFEADEYTAIA